MKAKMIVLVMVIVASLPLIVGAALVGGTWASSPRDRPTRVIPFWECMEDELAAATGLTNTTAAMENLTKSDPLKVDVIQERCQSQVSAQELENQIRTRGIEEFYVSRNALLTGAWTFMIFAALAVGMGVLAIAFAWVLAPADERRREEE